MDGGWLQEWADVCNNHVMSARFTSCLHRGCLREWADVCKNRAMSARIAASLEELCCNASPWPRPRALSLRSGSSLVSKNLTGGACKHWLMPVQNIAKICCYGVSRKSWKQLCIHPVVEAMWRLIVPVFQNACCCVCLFSCTSAIRKFIIRSCVWNVEKTAL